MAAAAPQVQYRQEFILGFAQRQSLLKDTTTKEMVIKGNQATFLVADHSGTAVTRGVNGLIPAREHSNTQVTATLVEKHDLNRMTNFNVFQSQADQRAIMQMGTMAVINRDMDLVILAELANGTLDTGSTGAKATLTMINKATTQLMNNGVPWDGNIFAVISGAFLSYLMDIPAFSSHKYVEVKPNVNYPGLNATTTNGGGQGWYEWRGVKWMVNSLITGVGTASEKCFMYHRSAIGHAADAAGVDSPIGYDEEQGYSWARCSLNHGAKILQNTGIVQMLHDGSEYVAT